MTIAGKPVRSAGTVPITNPATGELAGHAPCCTKKQLDLAVGAAVDAYQGWAADETLRRTMLGSVSEVLKGNADELSRLITAEQGKPLRESRIEILGSARWMRWYAEFQADEEIIQDDARGRVVVRRRPIGPVAAITPWNYPITTACWKLAPALRAGNTVVLKPSPFTPLATLRLGELLGEVLPPGVVNVVSGTSELGPWVTGHPGIRKISFTGSTDNGRAVARAAVDDLKRVSLELGGNDAALVLFDANVQNMAERIFWNAFANNGQTCTAIKRVYVPERLSGELVEALVSLATSARVGNGMDEATQLGPISNPFQRDLVEDLLHDAVSRDGRIAAGGRRLTGPGYCFEPTIVTGVLDGERIVDEEQFGPVLPIIAYQNEDDVIDCINASRYGLGSSIWSSDPDRAVTIARRIESGMTWINTHIVAAPHQPFGGIKWSGIGVENGRWGYESFTELQMIHVSP